MRDSGAPDAAGFVHDALVYRTPAEFTAGVLPFVEAGAAAREAVKAKGKKPRKAASGQREMLLPISGSGKRAAKETVKEAPKKAEKPVRTSARTRKAG